MPGDTSAAASTYGPETAPASVNPPAADKEDEEIDLFGSDEESEEDAEKEALTKKRLAEYAAKKVNILLQLSNHKRTATDRNIGWQN